jgi:hypothetical protein
MPISLHRDLLESAREEGVSLNQFVCALLASGVRWRGSRDAGDPTPEIGEPATEGNRSQDRISEEKYREIWRKTFC